MDEDWDIWEDWDDWEDYDEPETPNTPDPFGGLSDYFAEILGNDWQSQLTPDQLAELSRLSTMNEEEFNAIAYANDEDQTGGFWNDLGNLFADTTKNLFGTAAKAGETSFQSWLNKTLGTTPKTGTTAGKTTATDYSTLIMLGLAGVGLWLVLRKR